MQKDSQILQKQPDSDMWTSLVEDFRAKTSVLREKWKVSKANALGCGAKCSELFGTLDLSTSSLKIRQLYLFEDSNKSYATFPKSGMMHSGSVYKVPSLDYNNVGKGYTLLPTPRVSSAYGSPRNRFFGSPTYRGNLEEYIRDGEIDGTYPNPELSEALMGFPTSWTETSV